MRFVIGEALTFPKSCLQKFLINNKEKQFLRLQNKIKIDMLSHLLENEIHSPLSLNKNIYDLVVEAIFVLLQL